MLLFTAAFPQDLPFYFRLLTSQALQAFDEGKLLRVFCNEYLLGIITLEYASQWTLDAIGWTASILGD